LKYQSPDGKPFFMMLSTPACHDPFTPADIYKGVFKHVKPAAYGSFNVSAKVAKLIISISIYSAKVAKLISMSIYSAKVAKFIISMSIFSLNENCQLLVCFLFCQLSAS
jgi:hypothetical protein